MAQDKNKDKDMAVTDSNKEMPLCVEILIGAILEGHEKDALLRVWDDARSKHSFLFSEKPKKKTK